MPEKIGIQLYTYEIMLLYSCIVWHFDDYTDILCNYISLLFVMFIKHRLRRRKIWISGKNY